MKYKLTIIPMQEKLPELRCLFVIENKDNGFYVGHYDYGSKLNRSCWKKMVESLNNK